MIRRLKEDELDGRAIVPLAPMTIENVEYNLSDSEQLIHDIWFRKPEKNDEAEEMEDPFSDLEGEGEGDEGSGESAVQSEATEGTEETDTRHALHPQV